MSAPDREDLIIKVGEPQLSLLGEEPVATAVFSPCEQYRYRLTRIWDPALPVTVFCMLNPSTADHEVLDPTVRRCVGFAQTWNTGGLVVVNAYAHRSTDPAGLWTVDDPVGPANDAHINEAAVDARTSGGVFVAAWGMHANADRAFTILGLPAVAAVGARSLGVTKSGAPRHPLYVRADTAPQPWPPATGQPG